MKRESSCSYSIQMMYGSFDDYRMRFFSWGGKSFLERVKQNKEQMEFMKIYYNLTKAPKFKCKIGDIV